MKVFFLFSPSLSPRFPFSLANFVISGLQTDICSTKLCEKKTHLDRERSAVISSVFFSAIRQFGIKMDLFGKGKKMLAVHVYRFAAFYKGIIILPLFPPKHKNRTRRKNRRARRRQTSFSPACAAASQFRTRIRRSVSQLFFSKFIYLRIYMH